LTTSRQTPTREHDLRMHLGVVIMALQMLSRPPTTPLQADQQELIDIIQRATNAMKELLDNPPARSRKKVNSRSRKDRQKTPSTK
jgi:light-regulated signal transduction histidine kinase (bacteriophytochrome)